MYEHGFTTDQISHLSRQLRRWMIREKKVDVEAAKAIANYVKDITKTHYDVSDEYVREYLKKANKPKNNFVALDYLIYRFLDDQRILNRPVFMQLGERYLRQLAMTLATFVDASFDNSKLRGKTIYRGDKFVLSKTQFSLVHIALTNNVSRGSWRKDIAAGEVIALFHPEFFAGPIIDGKKITPAAIGIVTSAKGAPKGVISLSGSSIDTSKMLRSVPLNIKSGHLAKPGSTRNKYSEESINGNRENIKVDNINDNMYTDVMYELVNANVNLFEEQKRKGSPAEILLYYAILAKNNVEAKKYIAKIDDINIRIPALGNETVLHAAARTENFEILGILLKRKDIDVEITDDECLVAWDHAIMWGARQEFERRYGHNFTKYTKPIWRRAISGATRAFG